MQISLRALSDQFFWRERITPRVVLESNDTHLINAMVEVGFMPCERFADDLSSYSSSPLIGFSAASRYDATNHAFLATGDPRAVPRLAADSRAPFAFLGEDLVGAP
jgi:hypothetical protein